MIKTCFLYSCKQQLNKRTHSYLIEASLLIWKRHVRRVKTAVLGGVCADKRNINIYQDNAWREREDRCYNATSCLKRSEFSTCKYVKVFHKPFGTHFEFLNSTYSSVAVLVLLFLFHIYNSIYYKWFYVFNGKHSNFAISGRSRKLNDAAQPPTPVMSARKTICL